MSSLCTLIVALKLISLSSPWAIVPLIYGIGTWGNAENAGDIILACGGASMAFF